MRWLAGFFVALMPGMLFADSITLKSGRVISGEILDEWEGRILMEVKKGITMIFERKDVKKVVKDKPPPAPSVKKPAAKKPVGEESSSVSSSTSTSISISTSTVSPPPAPPTPATPEKVPAPASTPAPAPTPAATPESGRR